MPGGGEHKGKPDVEVYPMLSSVTVTTISFVQSYCRECQDTLAANIFLRSRTAILWKDNFTAYLGAVLVQFEEIRCLNSGFDELKIPGDGLHSWTGKQHTA